MNLMVRPMAVVVAGFVGFMFGAIRYARFLFGNSWPLWGKSGEHDGSSVPAKSVALAARLISAWEPVGL
jgi:hypothetical protein